MRHQEAESAQTVGEEGKRRGEKKRTNEGSGGVMGLRELGRTLKLGGDERRWSGKK